MADIRTGVLTKEEAADIANRLSEEKWKDMFGKQYNEPSLDCGGSTTFDNQGVFSCICGCPSFSAPARTDDTATKIVSELVVKGVPINGELRAVSRRYVENCDGWSDSILIEEVVQSPIDSYNLVEHAVPDCNSTPDTATQSSLLDGDTARDLRALRKTSLSVTPSPYPRATIDGVCPSDL